MDWTLAIEKNREALKRVLAMLVGMAGLSSPPLEGEDGSARRGEAEALDEPGEGSSAFTLPRHLHRAILRLLRPAESAARRLVIVAARGLVVELPPLRPRKPQPRPTMLRNGVGTGIIMPPGSRPPAPLRARALPLLDRLRPFRPGRRHQPQSSIPRISFPGVSALSPIAPRLPAAPDDPLDATRLTLRLRALGEALNDLPRQAERFARWRARAAAGAQTNKAAAAGAQKTNQRAANARRIWPLRPGRPPGQRAARRRTHEIHEILHDLHGLAFDVLERRDTS